MKLLLVLLAVMLIAVGRYFWIEFQFWRLERWMRQLEELQRQRRERDVWR
jgi:hypothetical protein